MTSQQSDFSSTQLNYFFAAPHDALEQSQRQLLWDGATASTFILQLGKEEVTQHQLQLVAFLTGRFGYASGRTSLIAQLLGQQATDTSGRWGEGHREQCSAILDSNRGFQPGGFSLQVSAPFVHLCGLPHSFQR